ncbi:MAG: hypothetical protein GF317_00010 [Candidatus Lokiarchaeota archaeon]|nr:hypothetical protein [Candidatus Lokiarchaeota archaeon]MBD3198370.1 hypothetical protein [Candidatus Lokiarchaeota archaeon]
MPEYEYFMVFRLLDSGERERIEVEEEDLESLFGPEQVYVIVKEDIRRIFIWKGARSPVRKRFISSRVASGLQEELVKEAAFHRCKIVSVDQGDEPVEFLKTFHLESMEVTDKMEDMRYIRNVDKDPTRTTGKVVEDGPKEEKEEKYYSPALEELKRKGVDVSIEGMKASQPKTRTSTSKPRRSYQKKPTPSRSKSAPNKKQVINKIIESEPPKDYERQNLVIGKSLFGATSKVTNVFGEDVEEIEWEEIKKVPDGIFLLDDYIFQIYFDKNAGLVEGIEILKNTGDGNPSSMKKSSVELPENGTSISEKILNIDPPENYARENLIVEHNLYGAVSKKVEVFGEEQIETDWSLVEKVPKEIISLDSHLFRVFFNQKDKCVDAIEIINKGKKSNNSNKKPIEKNESTSKSRSKRKLPEIPKA